MKHTETNKTGRTANHSEWVAEQGRVANLLHIAGLQSNTDSEILTISPCEKCDELTPYLELARQPNGLDTCGVCYEKNKNFRVGFFLNYSEIDEAEAEVSENEN